MRYRIVLACGSLLLVGVASSGGCSTDDTESVASSTQQATCASAMTALCDKACACTGTDVCAIAVPEDAGTAGISFKSKADCTQLYVVLGCGYGHPSFDFDACETAIASAECIAIGVSGLGSDKGVAAPDACQLTQKQ